MASEPLLGTRSNCQGKCKIASGTNYLPHILKQNVANISHTDHCSCVCVCRNAYVRITLAIRMRKFLLVLYEVTDLSENTLHSN